MDDGLMREAMLVAAGTIASMIIVIVAAAGLFWVVSILPRVVCLAISIVGFSLLVFFMSYVMVAAERAERQESRYGSEVHLPRDGDL